MFQLLQPIWLFALAGLSIPVIVHLWNQRPGKTLRVGSIALVTENTVSQKKSIKLTEILLLLLRCILLACIAVALAEPFWKQPANSRDKGWVLMSKEHMAATYQHFKPVVDSLIQSGMVFHYFEDGFAKDKLENAVNAVTDTGNANQISYRSIVNQLNEQVDATLPLYIFTDNYLRHFSGNRAAVSLNLHWFTYTPDLSSVKPIADTNTLHITVYEHGYVSDARYIKAALDAVQQFSKKNIVVKQVTATPAIPAKQDWLFWIADETIPANITASNVLLYVKGKAVPNASVVLPAEGPFFEPVALYSSIAENNSSKIFSDIYWKDGFGNPLLAAEKKNNTVYYSLYTHIDPSWNELPWSENFPQLLYQLLYAKQDNAALTTTNNTVIDNNQLLPVILTEKQAGLKPALFTEIKLSSIFWLLGFIFFFAERALSFYQSKLNMHG